MKKALILFFIMNCINQLYSQKFPIEWKNTGKDFPPFPFVLVNSTAIPCVVSDNCKPFENYIPVWRNDANNNITDCPSPIFVRKDVYTCNKVLKQGEEEVASNTVFVPNDVTVVTDPNAGIDPNCKSCNIGFVGINTTAPEEQLHVLGNIKVEKGSLYGNINTTSITNPTFNKFDAAGNPVPSTSLTINSYSTEFNGDVNIANGLNAQNISTNLLTADNINVNGDLEIKNASLKILSPNGTVMWNFRPNGKLGVGVTDAEMVGPYYMWVKEGIMTERLKVAVKNTNDWSDFVFSPDYKLKPLDDVEKYIKQHKHLPDIPNAEEMVKNGLDVQIMDARLLQKVEELTLYVIQLKNELNELKDSKFQKSK